MDILTAKLSVIDAGKKLVENGLIARTWGNISCRVDCDSFAITPSGKPYETLTPEQIVLVRVSDLGWEGEVKPSGEKGVHAEVYKNRPDVEFVVHTHQTYASVLSCLGADVEVTDARAAAVVGNIVPMAAYGLPSTKTLINGVGEALRRADDAKAVFMSHHGALCFGTDSDKTFETAMMLEEVCERHILARYASTYGETAEDIPAFIAGLLRHLGGHEVPLGEKTAAKSRRDGERFVLTDEGGNEHSIGLADAEKINGKDLPAEATLHRAVYRARPDIGCIVHDRSPETVAVACLCEPLKPQVDDFAQIIGPDARCAAFDPKNAAASAEHCVKALKKRHALLLSGEGALCCGPNTSDAAAVEMILRKNALAFLGTKLYDAYKPISPLHSHLMRFIYLKKYSKQSTGY